MSCKYLS